MGRDIYINGETMVNVKGNSGSAIGSLTQLGLTDPQGIVTITLNYNHDDILVDAFGPNVPMDEQVFLSDAEITMTLVHFDEAVLEECLRLSLAAPVFGQLSRAGTRMGANNARFAVGNSYIGLNIASPVAAKPWRFLTAYLTGPPVSWPLGTKRSLVSLKWRAVPYVQDPWGGGTGSQGVVLFDRTADT